MKTRIIKVTFVAAIAMVSAINAFNANKAETVSDIALANVEALVEDEDKAKYSVYPCPDSYGTECNTASKDRPSCSTKTYCP